MHRRILAAALPVLVALIGAASCGRAGPGARSGAAGAPGGGSSDDANGVSLLGVHPYESAYEQSGWSGMTEPGGVAMGSASASKVASSASAPSASGGAWGGGPPPSAWPSTPAKVTGDAGVDAGTLGKKPPIGAGAAGDAGAPSTAVTSKDLTTEPAPTGYWPVPAGKK